MALVVVLSIGILLILEYFIEFLLFRRVNQSPLELETLEGTGQAYHPSVVFFKEPWFGYEYWMAQTPYPIGVPPYRDRWECPSIHVSHDGLNWRIPEGLKNPIDDLSASEIANKDFFSDPHLVYKDGHLECFYRFSKRLAEGFHTVLLRKTSEDGVNWREREVILDFFDSSCKATVGDMVRSPAILWEDGRYKMWYVDSLDPKGDKHVCYTESPDGFHWSERSVCRLNGGSVVPWHLDLNKIDGEYILTVYDFQDLILFRSTDGHSFELIRKVLSPSGVYGCFYSDGLYRSSLIKDSEGYKLYFSAFDDKKTRIGLMEGECLDKMKVISARGQYKSLAAFLPVYAKIWKVRLWKLKVS